jgi:hypothetical protein
MSVISIDVVVPIVVATLGLISTVLGAKYSNAMNKASKATETLSDLTLNVNKVIIAAKDAKVDENSFQAIVDDINKLVNGKT